MILLLALQGFAATPTELVPRGADWAYLDDGVDPGPDWVDPTYDDSSWLDGPAPLGFGVFETTTVDGGDPAARHITTWFRHTFDVPVPADHEALVLELRRDDGAVVWLNGVEIHRSNLPSPSDATTLASEEVFGLGETTFETVPLDASLLVAGDNVLAVEIHQESDTSDDLAFDASLTGYAGDPAITRGPYLQQVTPDSIVVRWRTDAPSEGEVTTLSGALARGPLALDHEIRLDGLLADTAYTYTVGVPGLVLAGGAAPHTFTTSPAPGTVRPVKMWVLGDSGTANLDAEAVADGFASLGETPDLWLMLGDNAYNSGTDAEYQAAVFDLYTDFLPSLPLFSTLGNHDGYSASSATQTGPYYDIFTLPAAGEAGGEPSGTEAYYSFDYANVHVVCLDSYGSNRAAGSAMLAWLDDDLAATTADWVVAFWHHPPYSKGSHDSDTESYMVDMRQNALPILEAHGVDLILSGHSHSYERSALIDGHYGPSSSFGTQHVRDNQLGDATDLGPYTKPSLSGGEHEGSVYVVAGSSGKISGGPLDHPAMLVNLNELGSVIVDVDGSRLTARFIDETGAVLDRFDIDRGVTSILELYTNGPAVEGEAVALHAYGEDPDGNEVVSYTWDFADGTPNGYGPDQVHLWADDGVVPVTVTVEGLGGEVVARTLDLPVANLAPRITDYGADPASVGVPVGFWIEAVDVAADTVSYTWDFGDGSTVFGDKVEHVFLTDGIYTVEATAADEDGGVSTATMEVVVAGTPPGTSALYVSPASEGSPVALVAGDDETVTTWSWDFHDGGAALFGQSVTYTWADDGDVPVTLTATDAEGDSTVTAIVVPVANVPPTDLQVSAPFQAVEGDLVSFVGSADDPGDDVLTYLWSFGDFTPVVEGPTVQHRFGDDGTFAISLAVSDGDGGVASLATAVDVSNAPPEARSLRLPTSVDEGQLATFTVEAHDPGDDTVTVAWAFGDGTTSSLADTQHAYPDEGVYNVLLTLDDGDGGTASVDHQVAVRNVPPSIEGTPATTVVLGAVYAFAPTVTDPGDDTLSFHLDGPDGAGVTAAGAITWTPTEVAQDVPFRLTFDDGTDSTSLAWTVDVIATPSDGSATALLADPPGGCGCTTSGGGGWAWWLLVGGGLAARRRATRPARR